MADLVIAEKADFVSIADAIREKAGLEDGMSFPDGFLEAVEGISGAKIIANYGVFTPASEVAQLEIEHGLGIIPEFAVIFPYTTYSRQNKQILLAYFVDNIGACFCRLTSSSSYGGAAGGTDITLDVPTDQTGLWGWGAFSANEQTIKFGVRESSGYTFKSGTPHCWIVAGERGVAQ